MPPWLSVFLGGGVGSVIRFLVVQYGQRENPVPRFSWTITWINLVGCLIFGLLMGLSWKYPWIGKEGKQLLMTGFLGGFTTFSTFGWELFQTGRENIGLAVLNAFVSVTLGWAAAGFGWWLGKSW